MANNDEHLSKEALKLFKEYQKQLAYESYGPHFSKIQEIEYKREYGKLVAKLRLDKK